MTRNLVLTVGIVLLFTFSRLTLTAQTNIASSNGYVVHVTIVPVSIIPSSASCPNGYNYNLNIHYVVTFTGTNIPASLYTLQGNVGCGTSTHFYSLPVAGGTGNTITGSNVWNPATNCATATVASLFCNAATLTIEGPGIAQQTLPIVLASGGPLAIKLADFSAEAFKEKVRLHWSTAFEVNNDYFSLERSTDGNSWSTIKTIKGSGNSSTLTKYETFDENPVVGNSYYCIKQTDIDGKFTYSDTRLVKYTSGDNIYAYPIPNTGTTVHFKGILQPKDMELTVRSISGATVFSSTLQTSAVELPLKAGVYIITLKNKTTAATTNMRYVRL